MQIEDSSLPTWDQKLAIMSLDGQWFDDQFIRFSACFLRRDIIIHTSTADLKYCGSPSQEEGDQRIEHQCSCEGPSIHIANIGNYHFQSIIAINCDTQGTLDQNSSVIITDESKMHQCNECDYTTKKASNLSRHELSKHSKNKSELPKKQIVKNISNSSTQSLLGFE